jgi:hypothetical protein
VPSGSAIGVHAPDTHATSVFVVLLYATLPAFDRVHETGSQSSPSHCQSPAGDFTNAVWPARARLHGGKPDRISTVKSNI